MTVNEHLRELYALPAHTYLPPGADGGPAGTLPAAASVAWRLFYDSYDDGFPAEDFEDVWRGFLAAVDTTAVRALIIGQWGECYDRDSAFIVELLASNADRFPALEAVFIGDLVAEEAEISWIEQADVTPVLEAYPRLREFGVRGGSGLTLRPLRHEHLRTLVFEAGGLPGSVVRAVAESDLPALSRLDLWLGVSGYGGDATVEDLAPILTGERLPALRSLGLKNSELQDEIAAAVAGAPVVARLHTLDLSMGTLTDSGAGALLSGQPLTHLARLDLAHHYLSDAVMERLREELGSAGVDVDLSDQEKPDEYRDEVWRYVAVSE
ncbi:STM4015 family protein [Streptomyces verrucosisporus]|uniref:STM4015 family protein n=1 Tax=Streptomyces verrucosisporus TaxID=1695161 RepID=UPI0019D28A24|nr:STM4015 family protein [Streptomyces verrucosisporus]MBN3931408.1 STM4015 family protein [Streptomyces verrucosisporus]